MSEKLVKQPNGLYAVFSSIVDDIILWDHTATELEAFYVERAAAEARLEVKEWVAGNLPGRKHWTPEEVVESIRFQHGDEKADKRLAQLRLED